MPTKTLLEWRSIPTGYGFFELVWVDDEGATDRQTAWSGQQNRLVGAGAAFGVVVQFASWSGAEVAIELLEAPPAEISHEWEDVAEVSTTVPSEAEPFWASFGRDGLGPLPVPPGTWRVRVSAQGRDAARDLVVNPLIDEAAPPPDRYLIQLWPAPLGPEEIHRQTSRESPIT